MNHATRFSVTVFAVLFVPLMANATAQAPDVLTWGTETIYINVNPLEPLLELNPDRRPESEVVSTGNWRGYIAHWELTQDHLYLTDVKKLCQVENAERFETEYRSAYNEVFPEGRPEYAIWFSGHLVIPRGELVEYVHLSYASKYGNYTIVTIEDGVVTEVREMDAQAFSRFRQLQYEKFAQSPEYKAIRKRLLDDDNQSDIDEYLFDSLIDRYISILYSEDEP